MNIQLASGDSLAVLSDLNLRIEAGTTVAILGRSGSGKTTLLTLLGMMTRPDTGIVEVLGNASSALNDAQMARFRNSEIGFIFQNYSLIRHLNVYQNVAVPLGYSNKFRARRHRRHILGALTKVGLADKAFEMPSKLSGGEQQRVAIARALVNRPRLILADEPTGALDSNTAALVLSEITQVSRDHGTSLVLVTHDPEIASTMDVAFELSDGQLHQITT